MEWENQLIQELQWSKKIKAKVEDLEKQGVKLYSMAPFTFFVWLMAQFDQHAASAAPSMGNTVLFE